MLINLGKPTSINILNVPWDSGLPAAKAYHERLSERSGFVARGRNHES
jgi:hypothetical protein